LIENKTSSPASEIAHVLFLDIVGYSIQTVDAQTRMVSSLTAAINACQTYTSAKASGQVLALPTGDGMALIFSQEVRLPALCASELWPRLREADLAVRMGIHSGLVQRQNDITGNDNVAGEGINVAQRIMDFADAGHILASEQHAAWLKQFDDWAQNVHEAGEGLTKHNERLRVFNIHAPTYGRKDHPTRTTSPAKAQASKTGSVKVVLLYKRNAEPDVQVLNALEKGLQDLGHEVFIDRHLKIGVEWAKAIEERIRSADAAVAILSDSSIGSEMLEYEMEIAHEEQGRRGKPYILPVRVKGSKQIDGPIGAIANRLHMAFWDSQADDAKVLSEISSALATPIKDQTDELQLEPVGGAVPADSPFYVQRATDPEFLGALRANESIILIKGPRQMGKTSMIARGARVAKDMGWRVVMTDFQKLSASQLATDDAFYKLLAATVSRQLKFSYDFASEWIDVFGANMNMDNFIREVLESSDQPLVWFMDEADKLFGTQFSSDFFGLVRSWHNSRAEPDGPWPRFTVVIGYATEAHLFIRDLNQSPFNVGRQFPLQPFNLEQTQWLNEQYGRPIQSQAELERLFGLIGGQPFLTRRALDVLARKTMSLEELLATADRDDGPFGDHLKRILVSTSQLESVLDAMKVSLVDPSLTESDGFYRLLAAGVLRVTPEKKVAFTSELYKSYLGSHLALS
jgi:class 3 adenylate cyclase